MGEEGRRAPIGETIGPHFGLAVIRKAGHLIGVLSIVGLLPLALWATSTSGISGSNAVELGDDHGVAALRLDPRAKTWIDCVVDQLDRDPAWDTRFTVVEASSEKTVIQPKGWRSAINGLATIEVIDSHLVVVDRRSILYDEPTGCSW